MNAKNSIKRTIYRRICVVDSAITDLSSIMKRFVQTGEAPKCSNMIDVYQYGNEDEAIDKKRIELGEDVNSVSKAPSDSFAKLSKEEMDLIPDAPNNFLEFYEHEGYIEQSYTDNERAKSYYRAKERERNGKSVMAQQTAVANAVKVAESLGYKKGESKTE